MGGLVRSELRKFFSTRMWWGLAIAVFVFGAGLALLFALLAGVAPDSGQGGGGGFPPLSDPGMVNTVYTAGLSFAYLVTLTVGVLAIGSEYRHKTITGTFLATPNRPAVMVGKVVALLAVGAFYGMVFLVGSVGVGAATVTARGYSAFPEPGSNIRTLALSLLVLGLWALIGLGAGILIPNQVAAILISVGVAWIVEPVAGVLLSIASWGQAVAQYLPSQATSAMVSQLSQNPDAAALSWWVAALVLAGYAAVMAGVGSWLTVRRDVT